MNLLNELANKLKERVVEWNINEEWINDWMVLAEIENEWYGNCRNWANYFTDCCLLA